MRLSGERREEIINAARTLKEFCAELDCLDCPCPFVQAGVCQFITKPPKAWGFACLLDKVEPDLPIDCDGIDFDGDDL